VRRDVPNELVELAKRLPPRALHTYYAACLLAKKQAPYEVVGGARSIAAMLGHAFTKSVRAALNDLESASLVKRVGKTKGQRLFVLGLRAFSGAKDVCIVCGDRPLSPIRGARHCGVCYQLHGRADRTWKLTAVDIWASGKAEGWSDWKIAYAIHVKTDQPLWGQSDNGGIKQNGTRGSGSGKGEGVIQWGVALGIFPATMMGQERKARRGEGADDGD
jgi:hypothetical protein